MVRGVLGNKCAGRHTLKTFYFKETIVCMGVFAALYLLQDGGGKLFCSDGGGDHLQAFLEGALGQQVAYQLTSFSG
jgi:hypothetical protein